jgi:hypothetical protein
MTHRFTPSWGALASVAIVLVALGAATVAGQTKTSTTKTWTPALTADGQPDLQGSWNYSTITPFERPSEFAGKSTFTNEEAAEFERAALANINKDRRDDEESVGGDRIVNGTKETDDLARAYNEFWWDRGTKVSKTNRTSLVVDPPDGKVPALTPEAQKRMAARREVEARPAWGPEDRPAGERCLHQQRTGPPINPGGYNNHLRIFQTPGQVAILTEQIHDTRIIPLDGRPHVGIRGWKGDSRGRWEGNTLVIDTVNFKDSIVASYRGSSPNMHLTERFSRLDADTLLYEYTVDDPASFTKPWTVQATMTRFDEPIYEYACHEGNYGIVGSLSGARFVDKAATKSGTK